LKSSNFNLVKTSLFFSFNFIAIFFLFVGCTKQLCINDSSNVDYKSILQELSLQGEFDSIARSMCHKKSSNTLLVTDFVDIKTHKSGRHGLFMGELLRGSLNSKCNSKIVQADFGSYFRVGKDGVKVLTRTSQMLNKHGYNKTYAIVGSFNMTSSALYIFTKKINVKNSKVVKQINSKILFTCVAGNVVSF